MITILVARDRAGLFTVSNFATEEEKLEAFKRGYLKITRAKVVALFTSKKELEKAYPELK